MLIIVPCGKKKLPHPAPAGRMYLGPYHLACRRWAEGRGRVIILSALHGLLPPSRVIDPYELRMGEPGSVGAETVRNQAKEMGLLSERVIALGGVRYTRICKLVWPDCQLPLAGVGGIGKQLRWLRDNRGA